MPKFNEYLTLKEVQELLPTEFSPTKLIDKIQKLYESPKGIILFKEAKIKDSNESQYGVKKETVLNYKVSYVCLTVGFNGILLIPSELLINYFDENDTSKFGNGRSELKVHIIGDRFILKGRKTSSEFDLTCYFIPNDFCDYVQASPIENIWQEAKAFTDYEVQYRKGSIRLRHESKMQKERIARIEDYTCQICGFHQSYVNENGKTRYIIEVDHIVEKSQGGGENINNLLVLCPNCHAKKTYGVIKINSDYSIEDENGERKLLKQNRHLNLKGEIA